jgi:tRNA A-37 threonylcarbamoyl transferase component Bud32
MQHLMNHSDDNSAKWADVIASLTDKADGYDRELMELAQERQGLVLDAEMGAAGAVKRLKRVDEEIAQRSRDAAVKRKAIQQAQIRLEAARAAEAAAAEQLRRSQMASRSEEVLTHARAYSESLRQAVEAGLACRAVLREMTEKGGVGFLVMEYLEGETLAARVDRGPMPAAEAVRCGIEIAGALDAAHRRGVMHRDLKPGNIILTRAGAKLLDFGLAKMQAVAATPEHTMTMAITAQGTIAGTFQYMSPEQLEGREADARSDIFAFGATLYEALTGKRAFQGASHASLIAAIMSADPEPVSNVQPMAPSAIDRVVGRCLGKDPDERWQTARDLRQELVWIQEGGSQAGVRAAALAARKPRVGLAWVAAGVLALAAAVLAIMLVRQEKPALRPVRLAVNTPEGNVLALLARPAISPDGEKILFAATNGTETRLYLYSLTTGDTQPVNGVSAINGYWSFDSRSLLVAQGTSLARVSLGGAVQPLPVQPLPLPFNLTGYSSWGSAGIITSTGGDLQWFQPDGSGAKVLRTPRPEGAAAITFPTLIPGGRWLMYNVVETFGAVASPTSIHLVSMDGKASARCSQPIRRRSTPSRDTLCTFAATL